MFQGGSERQVRTSHQAASSHRPEEILENGAWHGGKGGTDCLVYMNTHNKQSSSANMGGLGSVLAVILAARLSMGTGQSLKVCVEMLLCKTDSHSGTPGPSPVLCNPGNSDSCWLGVPV